MTLAQLINSGLEKEIHFAFSKSGGKGGQHVNKTESKASVFFHISSSNILPETAKGILLTKLKNRINDKGELVLSADSSRSQHENKALVVQKFYELIANALKPKKPRKASKPTRSSKEKKKKNKIHHKKIKALRKKDF